MIYFTFRVVVISEEEREEEKWELGVFSCI